MKLKSHSDLREYMWKLYPKDTLRDYKCREAMLKAFDFLTGKVDEEEQQRKKIAESIYNKIKNEFPQP